jgi:hypothetical protein
MCQGNELELFLDAAEDKRATDDLVFEDDKVVLNTADELEITADELAFATGMTDEGAASEGSIGEFAWEDAGFPGDDGTAGVAMLCVSVLSGDGRLASARW